MNKPVWSPGVKLLGNLIPAIIALPIGVLGVLSFNPVQGLSGKTLGLLIAFPVVGWIAMNLFGLWWNAPMRAAIARKLDRARPGIREERYFVGASLPGYRNALDPHQDIGFLIVTEDSLEFFGDTLQVQISKGAITSITTKFNAHSLVFAGGWILIKSDAESLNVELRESPILLMNFLARKKLLARLNAWLG